VHWAALLCVDAATFALPAAAILAVLTFAGLPGLTLAHAPALAGGFALYGCSSIVQVRYSVHF
jgi:hypothetical protein